MREAFISRRLVRPAFKYCHLVKAGPHYYFSGMLAQDRHSGAMVGDSVGEQAEKILENLQVAMEEFDLGFEHLCIARIFTPHMEKFGEINAAWEKVFNAVNAAPPARTSVGVTALPLNAKVEIEFTFYRED
jgi:2-iminobutanoate/2-iminopropanoate deaminase